RVEAMPARPAKRAAVADAPAPPEATTQTLPQHEMLALPALHARGAYGAGVRVAVMDNGFMGVDTMRGFAVGREAGLIIAGYDFVENDDDVFNTGTHGTNVLAVMAARHETAWLPAAPEAQYILFRTEDDATESRQEELNWAAAAEWADSIGAHI